MSERASERVSKQMMNEQTNSKKTPHTPATINSKRADKNNVGIMFTGSDVQLNTPSSNLRWVCSQVVINRQPHSGSVWKLHALLLRFKKMTRNGYMLIKYIFK